jgi:hypothetical protein
MFLAVPSRPARHSPERRSIPGSDLTRVIVIDSIDLRPSGVV